MDKALSIYKKYQMINKHVIGVTEIRMKEEKNKIFAVIKAKTSPNLMKTPNYTLKERKESQGKQIRRKLDLNTAQTV